jgi:hypothetical protein
MAAGQTAGGSPRRLATPGVGAVCPDGASRLREEQSGTEGIQEDRHVAAPASPARVGPLGTRTSGSALRTGQPHYPGTRGQAGQAAAATHQDRTVRATREP